MNITFPVKLYQKLLAYTDNIEYEISGFGKISNIGENFYVDDIKIFEQSVSEATTILDKDGLGKFYDNIIKEEGSLKNWKMWWHSHAKMSTFWSKTDVDTINYFDSETDSNNWMIALEINHKHNIIARLDIFSPIRITIPLEVTISYYDIDIYENALTEIELNVKTPISIEEFPKESVEDILKRFKIKNNPKLDQ